jgi:cellulose synthase (UDP-forming)
MSLKFKDNEEEKQLPNIIYFKPRAEKIKIEEEIKSKDMYLHDIKIEDLHGVNINGLYDVNINGLYDVDINGLYDVKVDEVKMEDIEIKMGKIDIKIDEMNIMESNINQKIFTRCLSSSQIIIAKINFMLIIISYLYFWLWIFQTAEVNYSMRTLWMLWLSLLFLFENIFHIWTQSFFIRMSEVTEIPCFYNEKNRNMVSFDPILRNLKIAMIVTKAPSEPFDPVLTDTLSAMLKQNYIYPYDVWIANEKNTPDIQNWCLKNNIKISCRDGIEEYHQKEWPKRTRCKEGNLRYFYDTHGDNYDIAFQFDSDHIPDINYLSSCMLAFTDPNVSYIAMPSINSRIFSWIATARMYNESYYYGPYQTAFSYFSYDQKFYMPNMTGSHYAVRIKDLKKIGGLGPELDEDLSTTMMFTSNNFKGVYSLNTSAHGEGPLCFEDGMCQEYQWARSAIILYFRWRKIIFPENICDVSFNIVLRFLSTGIWYFSQTLWLIWFICSPIIAYYLNWCTEENSCKFSPIDFFIRLTPVSIISFGHYLWCRNNDWLKPKPPIITLTTPLYRFLRTIWMSWGIFAAIFQLITGKVPTFKVTPKGENGNRLLSPWALSPIITLIVLELFLFWIAFIDPNTSHTQSIYIVIFVFFLLFCLYFIVINHYIENHKEIIPWINLLQHLTILIILTLGFLLTVSFKFPYIFNRIIEYMVIPQFNNYDLYLTYLLYSLVLFWSISITILSCKRSNKIINRDEI